MFGVRNSAVSLPAERFMEGAGGGGGTQEEDVFIKEKLKNKQSLQ